MPRRVAKSKIESLGPKARVVRKAPKKEAPKEQPPVKVVEGVDPKTVVSAMMEGFRRLSEDIASRPNIVEAPQIEVPPPPPQKKVKKIVITNVSRNRQNRIDGVEMDVEYED